MRARTRLLLDLVIACGLIAAYRPTWTGISLHEWVSIAIIVPLAIHLVVNWDWVVRIATTFVQRLFHASRANFVVDSALLVASVAVMLSGIMVSPIPSFFGIQAAQPLVWATLHAWSADAIIALFAVHAALHWRWVVATVKRLAADSPAFAGVGPGAPRPLAAPARVPATAPAGKLSPAQARRAARLAAEKATARRNAGVLGVAGVTLALGSLIFASVALAGPELSESLGQRGASAVALQRSAQAGTAVAQAAPAKPAPATQVCPRTGCAASSCHGANGVRASVWYKTHS